jgi:hypothetical protein
VTPAIYTVSCDLTPTGEITGKPRVPRDQAWVTSGRLGGCTWEAQSKKQTIQNGDMSTHRGKGGFQKEEAPKGQRAPA